MVDVERRIREVKILYPRVSIVGQSEHYNKEVVRQRPHNPAVVFQESIDSSQEGNEQL